MYCCRPYSSRSAVLSGEASCLPAQPFRVCFHSLSFCKRQRHLFPPAAGHDPGSPGLTQPQQVSSVSDNHHPLGFGPGLPMPESSQLPQQRSVPHRSVGVVPRLDLSRSSSSQPQSRSADLPPGFGAPAPAPAQQPVSRGLQATLQSGEVQTGGSFSRGLAQQQLQQVGEQAYAAASYPPAWSLILIDPEPCNVCICSAAVYSVVSTHAMEAHSKPIWRCSFAHADA